MACTHKHIYTSCSLGGYQRSVQEPLEGRSLADGTEYKGFQCDDPEARIRITSSKSTNGDNICILYRYGIDHTHTHMYTCTYISTCAHKQHTHMHTHTCTHTHAHSPCTYLHIFVGIELPHHHTAVEVVRT